MKTRSIRRIGFDSIVMALAFVMTVGLTAGPFVDAAIIAMPPVETEATVDMEMSGFVEPEAATASQVRYRYVRCNSSWRRKRTCNTWGRNPVTLWRRHSSSSCVRRQDWNTRNSGRYVWVDNGCQATFRVRVR